MMKTGYRYVTLRYVHDVVTEEFVNVGVVVFAPDHHFLRARFSTNCVRLNGMFGQIDEAHFKATIEHLEVAFTNQSEHLEPGVKDIHDLVGRILPADDSSLQWSRSGGGLTRDPSETLNHLFSRFVERYMEETPVPA